MSVSAELQKAIFDALVADADVSAFVGDRIYDGAPKDPEFPYVTFGPTDSFHEDLECITARTETVQLDVWSRDGARMRPCKEICDSIKSTLHLAGLTLSVCALVQIRVDGLRVFLDRDGETAHGVVTVEAEIEEA